MALSIKEQIFNKALGAMGDYKVEEGKTNTNEYLVCNEFYEDARKRAIKSHPWNECVKRKIVVREEFGPIFGYAYQYTVPTDRLRVLSISSCEIDLRPWTVEGSMLLTDVVDSPQTWIDGDIYSAGEYVTLSEITYLCNVSNTASSATSPDIDAVTWTTTGGNFGVVYLRYIYNNEDESTYSEDLRNAIGVQLAILVAPRLQNDIKTKNALIQQNEQITLPKARSVDSQESKPRRFYSSKWNRSRSNFFRRSR
jgi:hypothetical protein